MILAIIDLGTNTFDLLVCKRDAGGRLQVLRSEERPVFLGRGGIEKGVVTEDAFGRGIAALEELRSIADAMGAERISGIGTSALRNARNGREFVRRVLERTGVRIEIVPGAEEAALVLDGVRQVVAFGDRPDLVMDIGGGSVEFILATRKALMWEHSYELGVTRLGERFVPSDPVTIDEELRIGAHLDERLGPLWSVIDRHAPHRLVGSSGSFDSVAQMIALERGEPLPVDACTMPFTAIELQALKDRILRMTRDERLQVPGLPEHRVGTIGLALIMMDRVLAAGGIRDLCWSRYALKEGAAARALGLT
ncbi:MAG: phosphatase [Flavobacteriales bacterium]|nr:phosphatase [Flavobacteriales bacterium]MCB9192934.1 phosphatase [Flavobacteriales bacterium]